MKKTAVLALLGIAAATSAYGQGAIAFDNSQPVGGPYYPVLWDAGTPVVGGSGVKSTQGVTVTLWYAEGNITDQNLLSAGPQVSWNSGLEGINYFGYYTVVANLPTWAANDVFTFQLRASGNSTYGPVDTALSRNALWTEQANIGPDTSPGISTSYPKLGLTVSTVIPEPSTFALAGLGAAALLIFRRRD